MAQFIRHFKATGIHGRFDLELDFDEGVNIVYGHNGTGKTTLLHILTNAANVDLERFLHLKFREVRVQLDDNSSILIERQQLPNDESPTISLSINDSPIGSFKHEDFRRPERGAETRRALYQKISQIREDIGLDLRATYFPAFRTMIEAWSSIEEDEFRGRRGPVYYSKEYEDVPVHFRRRTSRSRSNRATNLARALFGRFVPALNYPSPVEIEQELNSEVQEAVFLVARTDQTLLSNAFVKAFSAISRPAEDAKGGEDANTILGHIAQLTEQLQESPLPTEIGQGDTVYDRLNQQLASFTLDPEAQDIAKRVLAILE